jgi:DnaD/phage-associated family protein
MEGWISLHRKLIENPIFLKPDLLQLFIYCLLRANHKPNKIIFNGKEMIIKRGQFITGREVLSKELKQNGITTYKRLKILENLDILNIKSNNKFSLVTVVNYDLYQSDLEESNNKSNNKGTTKEQPGNTNNNDNNYISSSSEGVSKIVAYFQKHNFGIIDENFRQEIEDLIDIDHFEIEVILASMHESVRHGKPNWAYACGILKKCKLEGILTIDKFRDRKKTIKGNYDNKNTASNKETGGVIHGGEYVDFNKLLSGNR